MAIANVALSDTFDQWRIKTNQLIVQSDQLLINTADLYVKTNAAFAKANSVVVPIIDETADATRYILFSSANTGNVAVINVSSAALTFNPSTGTLNATTFNSLSDREQKENIRLIEHSVDKIEALNGVHFTWKKNGEPSAGIIAQDLKEVMPELVGDDMSVNYSGIIGVLVEAIKELNERIKKLENK